MPSDRERKKIGVGEQVTCSVDESVGSVTWTIESGGGCISQESGLSTTFTAPDRAATCIVKATTADDKECTVSFNVVEPSGVRIEQEENTNVWHVHNWASVGFRGRAYILPADVSFQWIKTREKDAAGVGEGYFEFLNGLPHGDKSWFTTGAPIDDNSGSIVHAVDTIASGQFNTQPFSNGTFKWPIPRAFIVGTGNEKTFTTVTHEQQIDANGDMTISKGGTSKSAAYDDPSSDY